MKRKGFKSYFTEILINMLLMLVVPFVTIMLLCIQTENTVKNQILTSNQQILNNAFQVFDTVFGNMMNDEMKISLTQDCERYANYSLYYPNKAVLQVLEVRKAVKQYLRDEYTDLFVYFPNADRVISAVDGTGSAENYYTSKYADKLMDGKAEYYEILECTSKRPTFYVINRNGEKPYLCLAMRKTNKNVDLDFVVVAILRPEFVKNLMYSENGTLLIFGEDKELLISGDQNKTDYYMKDYDSQNTLYEIELENGSAMMQIQKSVNGNIYYAFATPTEYFWQEISGIRMTAGLHFIMCMLVGITWAYWNAKKTYRPVDNMMQHIQEKYEEDVRTGEFNEFELIEKLLNEKHSENETLRRKAREGTNMKRDYFLTSIMTNDFLTEEKDFGGFKENDVKICSDEFVVVALTTDNSDNKDIEAFVMKNVFEEVCNREHLGYLVNLYENRYAILVNKKENTNPDRLTVALREAQDFLRPHGFCISIGIGETKRGMAYIHQSYKEATHALRYTYLLGKNTIIFYQDICDREFQHLTSSENLLLKKVLDFAKGKDSREASRLVDEIVTEYGIDDKVSIETVECFQYEIIGVINRSLLLQGMQTESREMIRELMNQVTLEQFINKLLSILLLLRQEEEEDGVEDDEVCRQVLSYVEAHYMDTGLSVSMLGELYQVSTATLSKSFKKKYEVTLSNYIAQVRIRNSKAALADLDKSIKDIAEECGFLSSNVYIKTFKKLEGITPGMYRELIGEKLP